MEIQTRKEKKKKERGKKKAGEKIKGKKERNHMMYSVMYRVKKRTNGCYI